VTITAPAVFSLIENPQGVLRFLKEVDQKLRTRHVFFDMRGITSLTAEAVAAFIGVIKSSRHHNVSTRGNIPKISALADKLAAFGFYDHVNSTTLTGAVRGTISLHTGAGEYVLREKHEVRSETAGELVDFARRIFPASLHKGVFTMLIETTTNTIEHASKTSAPVPWIAGAYFDEERKVLSFTVIDRGVGILGSVKFQKNLKSIWGMVSWDAGEKLRQLLLGKMRSQTQQAHRGKGLPGAFLALQAGRIADLAIISNDGFAHPKTGRYLETPGFDGTIVYWEVGNGDSQSNETQHQR
jgi:anti-sigma regulatory factor (Ser/Thr protein kinase)